jgi:hypothetical protein
VKRCAIRPLLGLPDVACTQGSRSVEPAQSQTLARVLGLFRADQVVAGSGR